MLKSFKRVQSLVMAVLLLGLMLLAGCLISSSTAESRSGKFVAESTFAQIEPGKTSVSWVQATLGEPTSKTTADGSVIYKYVYTERRDSSGAVFLIFGSSKTTETEHAAYVEFRDGIVVNKWRA